MKENNNWKKHRHHSRGVALITALLLLSLFTIMTLAMVIATSSDLLIDGYYRNFRGSFYASDSGTNAARQYLVNQLANAVPASYVPYSGPPISTGTEATTLSALTNTSTGFGAYQSFLGSQTSSWPGTFKIDPANTTLSAPTCLAAFHKNTTGTDFSTPPTCTNAGSNGFTEDSYAYTYPYQITVLGQSRSNEQNTAVERGSIILNVALSSTSTVTKSFAAWGMFIDQSPLCPASGGYLVPGTVTGPVFTNGNWNFGPTGSYIFTDSVGSAGSPADFGYQFGGNKGCVQSSAQSASSGGTTIAPKFQGGVNLGANPINAPANSWQQERAVLDGLGTNTAQPIAADLSAALVGADGKSYPSAGASSGVYVPVSTQAGGACPCTFNGGGIYVEGNADSVALSAATVSVSATNHDEQIFTIKQGTTITTVTLDLTGNQTTISDNKGKSTGPITGLPQNKNGSTSTWTEAAMLFVNGNISDTSGGTTTGLSGPSSGAAIQDGSAVTVTAAGSISITGSLTYKTEPVTLSAADTLVAGADHGQVLGIFTSGGNVNLALPTSGSNLEIDASIATLQSGGNWAIVNPGNAINTLTIVGGRIQNSIQNINTTTRNIYYDRRFSQGFAPPWFPSTTLTTTGTTTATVNPPTASRVSWVNTTAQ